MRSLLYPRSRRRRLEEYPSTHMLTIEEIWVAHVQPLLSWQTIHTCSSPIINTNQQHLHLQTIVKDLMSVLLISTPTNANDPIPFYQMIYALVSCFNLSWFNAIFLTLAANIACGNGWSVSMAQLGQHDKIEHDASLSRFDHEYVFISLHNPKEVFFSLHHKPVWRA